MKAGAVLVDGGAGAAHVLALIEAEMPVAMSLTGCARVRDITGGLLLTQ